jgi:hypothetical protein
MSVNLTFLFAVGISIASQVEKAEQDAKTPAWAIIARRHAGACKVYPAADRAHPFELISEPVLHRAQEVQGSSTGSTYVWKEPSGRPAVIGDVILSGDGVKQYRVGNEWHSLSDASLAVEWDGRPLLMTSQPGLEWKPLPDAPAVADKPLSRQRQARQLAERFTAHLVDRKQARFELRLLTTPLYRYDTTDFEPSQGGALFAFCQQTDPEILLLIESRKSGSIYRWEYAVAGFSDMNLYLHLDGNEIWRDVPPFSAGRGVHTGGRVRIVDVPAELEAAKREK